MRRLSVLMLMLIIAGAAVFLLLERKNFFEFSSGNLNLAEIITKKVREDIENQKPLPNPPDIIKGIYATNWSMTNSNKVDYFLNLIDSTELNAIIIDIKDYTGIVPYKTDIDLVNQYHAWEKRILKPNQLIKDLHDKGIYVIARISVFQDLHLAKARPDLALISASAGSTWKDYKGLTWLDSSSQEVWDYNIDIARDALDRGFDEINFDYIRFASDGNLKDIQYPFWDGQTLKITAMRTFFEYLRNNLPDAKLSADLFGLTTINTDGLGIGQHLEYALPHFDFIAPMVYPSHYFKGFIGYPNPAEAPYEVIKYSMETAVNRAADFLQSRRVDLANSQSTQQENNNSNVSPENKPIAKFRPWLQDFDLGADYDSEKVRAEISGWNDAAINHPELNNGWMLWNASNVYTKGALLPEL